MAYILSSFYILEHIYYHHNSHADLRFSHIWKCSFHGWNRIDDHFNYNSWLTFFFLTFWKQNSQSRNLCVLSESTYIIYLCLNENEDFRICFIFFFLLSRKNFLFSFFNCMHKKAKQNFFWAAFVQTVQCTNNWNFEIFISQ